MSAAGVIAAPAIVRLDGPELARALKAGIRRLLADQEHLDRINVYPVPDGDTGTNLAITMGAVLAALKQGPVDHAGQLLTRVADAALDGARGNSGAILAQFFLGLGDRVGHLKEIGVEDFVEGVQGGATYARDAIAEPREGTILTVAQDFATEVRQLTRQGVRDFRALVRRGLERAHRSLDATKDQLDSLRKAGVVDAGAAGFVTLLDGISGYLETGQLDESEIAAPATHDEAEAAGGEARLEHRWCTECMVNGEDVDRRHLRERLAAIGSSLVVAGTQRKVRVHVHVADPAEVFRIAAEFGTVGGQKADDMQRQQEAALHSTRRKVAVVTDSAADIPEEELERLDIHLVPVRVHFGDHSYLDKVTLTPDAFYGLLADPRQPPPKTSQPPPGDFRRAFEFLASHYESVVSVNLTGRASGTRQAAEAAAARVAARDRVTVIDTLNASIGQGLLVTYAAECAARGMNGPEVAAAVRAMIPRTFTYGYLATLDYGVRGGRVPAIARTLANLVGARIVIMAKPDGRVTVGGALFGGGDFVRKYARFIRRRLDPAKRYRLLVGHGDAREAGEALLAAIADGLDNVDAKWVIPCGTALGAHGGPGMLVVGFQEIPPP